MEEKKLLPLGTVVALDEETQVKMVIAGYYIRHEDGQIYDYLGLGYPFGMALDGGNSVFNAEAIEQVLFTGYETEKSRSFLENLPRFVEQEENLSLAEIQHKRREAKQA